METGSGDRVRDDLVGRSTRAEIATQPGCWDRVIDEAAGSLMPVDEGFRAAVRDTGADLEVAAGDPLVELIRLQRYAVACAQATGRDPDNPGHLTRSVVLS